MRRFFLVEDHAGMRRVLRQLIEENAAFKVVGEADSAEAALLQLPEVQPDVCLVDLSLPGMSGLAFIQLMHEDYPDIRFLVVTGHNDPQYRTAALAAGANDFVIKDDPDDVLEAIHTVINLS